MNAAELLEDVPGIAFRNETGELSVELREKVFGLTAYQKTKPIYYKNIFRLDVDRCEKLYNNVFSCE